MKPYETLVRIDVTDQDIVKGKKGECKRCPVALAIQRKVLSHLIVQVGLDIVRISEPLKNPPHWHGENVCVNEFPPGVGGFIAAFDFDQPVQPFSFELELPTCFLNLPNQVG